MSQKGLFGEICQVVTKGVLYSSDAELEHNGDLGIFSRSTGNHSWQHKFACPEAALICTKG